MLLNSLINIAKRKPTQVAFVTEKENVTFKETIDYIINTSLFLQSKGCSKNNKVIIYASNSLEWVFSYYALQYFQAIPVIIGKFVSSKHIQYIILKYKIKHIITDKKINLDSKSITNILTKDIEKRNSLNNSNLIIKKNFKQKPSFISEILFTSGSTSKPKGVVLTNRSSFYIGKQISHTVKVSSQDKEILLLPLSHSFGLGRLKSMAINGNKLIVIKNLSNPAQFIIEIEKYKANGFGVVPTSLSVISKFGSTYTKKIKPFLKFIELGSETIDHKTIDWLKKKFPKAKIYHHYGMTEASRSVFLQYTRSGFKKNFIGKPSKYASINILDKTKRICKTNNVGEIAIKGPFILKNYINNKKNIFCKHGFLTGDFGYKDRQGNIFLIGRKDSLIKINGINVSLNEVEKCINNHPSIKESLCIIKENISKEEKFIEANIVCGKNFNLINLIKYMQKNIESYKIPKKFKLVKALPKSESNKLLRHLQSS